jgi:hypothetical protein
MLQTAQYSQLQLITNKVFPIINQDKKLLIDYYKNKGGFRMYFCYLTDDFVNIIRSQTVTGLHVFGHGSIDHLVFQDGVVYYREFYRDFTVNQLKDFVCQWHCNKGKYTKKHLGKIVKKYFVPEGYRNFLNNKKDIEKFIDGTLNWTINE